MNILRLLMRIREPITITSTDGVQSSLSPIELEESQIEQSSNNDGSDGEGTEEPGELLLDVDRDESEVEGGGDGGLELREGHDERLHLLGSLGESVFQRGDGSEDLGDTDEDVRSGNDPNVDRSGVGETIGILTRGGLVIVARRRIVDELLENGGVQHGKSGDEETGVDALDRGEVDSHLPESGVDDLVEDGDENDDGDGVQVLNQVVGGSVQGHAGSDGAQITIDLGVAQPEEGEPTEHLAGLEGTSDFTNELVVPGDPGRDNALFVGAWLGRIPETRLLEVFPGGNGVDGDPGTSSDPKDAKTLWGRGDEGPEIEGRKIIKKRTSRMTDPRGGVFM